jgi:membrane-associated protein
VTLLSAALAASGSTSGITRFIDPSYLVDHYGLVGLALIIFAETGLLVGFFLPGDSLLFLAGAFTATSATSGDPHLVLWQVLAVTFPAAVLGAQTGWAIGRFGGQHLMHREDSRLFKRAYVVKTHEVLETYGEPKAVVLARFIPIVRTFINPVMGATGMSAQRFALWNAVGALPWAVGVVLLGRTLGKAVHIDTYLVPVTIAIIVLSALPIVLEARRHRAAKG